MWEMQREYNRQKKRNPAGYNPDRVWEARFKPLLGTSRETFLLDEDLRGTPLGDKLLKRMRTGDWDALGADEVPQEWNDFLVNTTDGDMLAAQQTMGIKRSGANPNICSFCANEATGERFKKCGRCLVAKYCSAFCQMADWAEHKSECAPPEPQVNHNLVFVLPACPAACAYWEWYGSVVHDDRPDILLEDRFEYEEAYGAGSVKRCLLQLAVHGKPSPRVCSMVSARGEIYDEVLSH